MTKCGIFFTILVLAVWINFSGLPAVSAENISDKSDVMNNSAASDPQENSDRDAVSFEREKLPELKFDTSQSKIVIRSALSPTVNDGTATLQSERKGAAMNPSDTHSIPQGAIIHHARDGITTVFDEDGIQLFSAEDASAGLVSTPHGYRPATLVHELPSGSILYPSGNITSIVFNDNIILVEINDIPIPAVDPAEISASEVASDLVRAKTSAELPVTDFDPDKVFLERVALKYTSPSKEDDIKLSSVQWKVPAAPKTVRPGQIHYLEYVRFAREEIYYCTKSS